jgi:hypothetical protein
MKFYDIVKAAPVTLRDAKQRVKAATHAALKDAECAAEVEQIRGNGVYTGHKVGDMLETTRVIRGHLPESLRDDFDAGDFNPWQRAQIVNGVLRSMVLLDKGGKFQRDEDGNILPRLTHAKA